MEIEVEKARYWTTVFPSYLALSFFQALYSDNLFFLNVSLS